MPKKSPRTKKAAVKKAAKKKLAKPAKKAKPAAKPRRLSVPLRTKRKVPTSHIRVVLKNFTKHEGNPIIEPRENNAWESKATFNPGAVFVDGDVHLLYRAIGDDDVSVLGYAKSSDGFTIDERSDLPAFTPKHRNDTKKEGEMPTFLYGSGGGWNGGCEDPRVTSVDGRIYLIYTAFDGWGSLRMALSSISEKDFLDKRWKWKKPALISPEGEIHKNWVLFPEKINGKYAILHSIAPEILIDYFDTLDQFDGKKNVVRSKYDSSKIKREGNWDNWVRGAGPPPIKTEDGWLLFYHAMDKRDPNRYKLGAMLLDLKDPTKVLYRSSKPLIEPNEYYENHGFKGGVIYSCGAGIIGDQLFVYYGGADTVVCVATASLGKFLTDLKKTGVPSLHAVDMKRSNARH